MSHTYITACSWAWMEGLVIQKALGRRDSHFTAPSYWEAGGGAGW